MESFELTFVLFRLQPFEEDRLYEIFLHLGSVFKLGK